MAWEEGISPTRFVPCIYSRWFFCFGLINWDSAVWKQWAKVKQESSGKEGEGLDWSYMFSSWPCMQVSIKHTHTQKTPKNCQLRRLLCILLHPPIQSNYRPALQMQTVKLKPFYNYVEACVAEQLTPWNMKKVGQLSQVLILWLQKSSKNYYGQGSLMKFVW